MRYAMEISEEMNAKIERDKKIKSEANRQEHLDKMKGASLGYSSSTYIGQDTTKFVTKQN